MRSVVKNLLNYRNLATLTIKPLSTSINYFQPLRKNLFQFSSENTNHKQIIMPAQVEQDPSIQENCLKLAYLAQKENSEEIVNWKVQLLENIRPFIYQLNLVQLKLFIYEASMTMELDKEDAERLCDRIEDIYERKEAILFDCLEAYNLTFGIIGESSELLVKIQNFIESSLENPELDASSFSLAVSAYSQIAALGKLEHNLEEKILNAIKRIDADYQIVLEGKQSNLTNFQSLDISRLAWAIYNGEINNKDLYTYLKNKSLQIEMHFPYFVKVVAASVLFQDQDSNLLNKLKQLYEDQKELATETEVLFLLSVAQKFEIRHLELQIFVETLFFDLYEDFSISDRVYIYSKFALLKHDSIKIWQQFGLDFDEMVENQEPESLHSFFYCLLDAIHLMEEQTSEKVLTLITDKFEQMDDGAQLAISEKFIEIGLVDKSEFESEIQQIKLQEQEQQAEKKSVIQ